MDMGSVACDEAAWSKVEEHNFACLLNDSLQCCFYVPLSFLEEPNRVSMTAI
jgi:hypothetical protein